MDLGGSGVWPAVADPVGRMVRYTTVVDRPGVPGSGRMDGDVREHRPCGVCSVDAQGCIG